jgi:hypothetical protein
MIDSASTNITGSVFITFLTLLIILVVMMLLFRISFEFILLFLIPFLLVMMAYDSRFQLIGGIVVFMIAFGLTIKWFMNNLG